MRDNHRSAAYCGCAVFWVVLHTFGLRFGLSGRAGGKPPHNGNPLSGASLPTFASAFKWEEAMALKDQDN
jgi:hypothetical protein